MITPEPYSTPGAPCARHSRDTAPGCARPPYTAPSSGQSRRARGTPSSPAAARPPPLPPPQQLPQDPPLLHPPLPHPLLEEPPPLGPLWPQRHPLHHLPPRDPPLREPPRQAPAVRLCWMRARLRRRSLSGLRRALASPTTRRLRGLRLLLRFPRPSRPTRHRLLQ